MKVAVTPLMPAASMTRYGYQMRPQMTAPASSATEGSSREDGRREVSIGTYTYAFPGATIDANGFKNRNC